MPTQDLVCLSLLVLLPACMNINSCAPKILLHHHLTNEKKMPSNNDNDTFQTNTNPTNKIHETRFIFKTFLYVPARPSSCTCLIYATKQMNATSTVRFVRDVF